MPSNRNGRTVTHGMLAGTPQEAQGPSTNTVSVEVTGGVGRDTISFTLVARKVNRLPRMAGATHSPLPTWIGITGDGPLGVLAPALPLTRTVLWMPTSLVVPDGVGPGQRRGCRMCRAFWCHWGRGWGGKRGPRLRVDHG